MNPREAFKHAFVKTCAERGDDDRTIAARVDEAHGLFVKQAWESLFRLPLYTALGVLGAGAAAGGLAGYGAAQANRTEVDLEDIKRNELIAAYNTYASRMRQRNLLNQARREAEANAPKPFRYA